MEKVKLVYSAEQEKVAKRIAMKKGSVEGEAFGYCVAAFIDSDGMAQVGRFTEVMEVDARSRFSDAQEVGVSNKNELFYFSYNSGKIDQSSLMLAARAEAGLLTAEDIRQHRLDRERERACRGWGWDELDNSGRA